MIHLLLQKFIRGTDQSCKESLGQKSCPSNFPTDFLDANLFAGLLIIVVPLTIREINTREWSRGLGTLGFPFSLEHYKKPSQGDGKGTLTSGLNSMNSKPRQSI